MPNAGKSTFLNAVLEENLVITNPKAQTTRHRIKGILNNDNYQLVFSDTPGIIQDAAYKLQDAMMGAVNESLEDADIVLLVLDGQYPKAEQFKPILEQVSCPIVIALNKIDLVQDQEKINDTINEVKSIIATEHVYAMSAKEKFNVDALVDALVGLASEHPPYYDPEILTDENVRFLVSEMVREQILSQYKKEVPYSSEVTVTDYKEDKDIDRIYATIYVERDSQKSILLGKGGASIKKLGIAARKRIEAFIDKKVFLSLTVKVRKDWRTDDQQLKNFGYLRK